MQDENKQLKKPLLLTMHHYKYFALSLITNNNGWLSWITLNLVRHKPLINHCWHYHLYNHRILDIPFNSLLFLFTLRMVVLSSITDSQSCWTNKTHNCSPWFTMNQYCQYDCSALLLGTMHHCIYCLFRLTMHYWSHCLFKQSTTRSFFASHCQQVTA